LLCHSLVHSVLCSAKIKALKSATQTML